MRGASNIKKLTKDIMWETVINNNSEYDGIFYYGVKTTKIFCRPSCKSKRPRRENVLFFATIEQAISAGHRPCKRCRPDLATFTEPIKEVIKKIRYILETEYTNPQILSELPARVGLSSFHLQRSFKKEMEFSPKTYLQQVQIKHAQELLQQGNLNNLEICFAVGFQSISSFYATFRTVTGFSPKCYSKNYHKEISYK